MWQTGTQWSISSCFTYLQALNLQGASKQQRWQPAVPYRWQQNYLSKGNLAHRSYENDPPRCSNNASIILSHLLFGKIAPRLYHASIKYIYRWNVLNERNTLVL
jgi:hypothetical protein